MEGSARPLRAMKTNNSNKRYGYISPSFDRCERGGSMLGYIWSVKTGCNGTPTRNDQWRDWRPNSGGLSVDTHLVMLIHNAALDEDQ